MTPEDLDLVLQKKDAEACLSFFSGASEKDRKAVAARAVQWHEAALAYEASGSPMARAFANLVDDMPKRLRAQLDLVKQIEKGVLYFPSAVRDKESVEIARLAVTASAGLTEIRKAGMPKADFAFRAVKERNPKWLDKFMNFACEQQPFSAWTEVRKLELEGVGAAEAADGYWLSMALCLGKLDVDEFFAYCKTDAEILDSMLWSMLNNDAAVRLLSDPTGVNEQLQPGRAAATQIIDWTALSARAMDSRRTSYIWKTVLVELVKEERIEKKRLLAIIFEWIARLSGDRESKASSSFATNTTPVEWFHSIHDELALSTEEKTSYAIQYIGLLSVRDSSTLKWAVTNLSSCKLSDLPMSDLHAGLSRLFYHKRKEPALAALQLLEQILKERTEKESEQASILLIECANVVLDAFEHPSSDIQKRALSFLKKTKAIQNQQIAQSLLQKAEQLSGLIKADVLEALALSGALATPASSVDARASAFAASSKSARSIADSETNAELTGEQSDSSPVGNEFVELLAKAKLLSGDLADAAEIQSAIDALEQGTIPCSLALDSMSIPRLDSTKKLEPIGNFDDLIFLFLHVLERTAKSDDVERLLDGLCRLCDQRPHDLEDRTSSLRKKVGPLIESLNHFAAASRPPVLSLDLAYLAKSWLDGAGATAPPSMLKQVLDLFSAPLPVPAVTFPGMPAYPAPASFFSERVNAVAKIISKRKALPLIAAPTHQSGWIDPRVLPLRLAAWSEARAIPELADIVQALLRLAPEFRAETLSKIPAEKAEHIRAIRWALGADMIGDVTIPSLWVAAFRCRDPRGTCEFLKSKFPATGPDGAQRATYIDRTEDYVFRSDSIYGNVFQRESKNTLPILVSPPLANRVDIKLFPTELLHGSSVFHEPSAQSDQYFLLDRESFFASQANRTAMFIESSGSYWTSAWDSLFDSDVALSGMGSWLLVIALSAKQPEAARLAIDATITGIEDDRIDGAKFGWIMARFLVTSKITLSRWITGFKDIARISPLHIEFTRVAMENCLADLPEEYHAKPPIGLLEVLYEAGMSSGCRIENASTRAFLEKIQGKGKGAKLAKLILELKDSRAKEHRAEVASMILQSRINRVSRWKERLETSSQSRQAAGAPGAALQN